MVDNFLMYRFDSNKITEVHKIWYLEDCWDYQWGIKYYFFLSNDTYHQSDLGLSGALHIGIPNPNL